VLKILSHSNKVLWRRRIDKSDIVVVIFLSERKRRKPSIDWIDEKRVTDDVRDVKAV
jgi:hypothetical protein